MARLFPRQTADRLQWPAVCPSHRIQLSKNVILPRPGFGRLGMDGGRLAQAHSALATALPRCRVLHCSRLDPLGVGIAQLTTEWRLPIRQKLPRLQNRPAQAAGGF